MQINSGVMQPLYKGRGREEGAGRVRGGWERGGEGERGSDMGKGGVVSPLRRGLSPCMLRWRTRLRSAEAPPACNIQHGAHVAPGHIAIMRLSCFETK